MLCHLGCAQRKRWPLRDRLLGPPEAVIAVENRDGGAQAQAFRGLDASLNVGASRAGRELREERNPRHGRQLRGAWLLVRKEMLEEEANRRQTEMRVRLRA